MPDENMGGLVVVITIAVLALILGCTAGSLHIGQQTSQQVLPTSLLSSEDQIKPVTENNETMKEITVKVPVKRDYTYNKTRNYTNYTNYTNNTKNRTTTNHTNNTNTRNRSNNPNSSN